MDRVRSRVWTAGLAVALSAAVVFLTAAPAAAQAPTRDLRYFRIGTGTISGVYFPVGALIAGVISNPPGSRPCNQGGSCGVPGLIAVAQATTGSIANLRGIGDGTLESALTKADMAHYARTGSGPFPGDAVPDLRAIAAFFPEAIQVVVRADSGITSIAQLRGKRVSLDVRGSATRVIAPLVLRSYSVPLKSIRQRNSQLGPAVDRLRAGELDAFFFVGGFPVEAIMRLSREVPLRLLPVTGAPAEEIRRIDPYFRNALLPEGTYRGTPTVQTIAVQALWVVSAKADADLVYGITSALWHPSSLRLLEQGPPAARLISLKTALDGLTIPLHPGAARFYREKGLLPGPEPASKPPTMTPPPRPPKPPAAKGAAQR